MKFCVLLVFLNYLYINSKYLRNLKLSRNEIAYQILVQSAKDTFYQMYNKTVNFNNRSQATYEDKYMKILILIDEYMEDHSPIDELYEYTSFKVKEGKPLISEILEKFPSIISERYLEAFSVKLNVKEKFIALSNMIAAGFNNGEVVIYERTIDNFNQIHYLCIISNDIGNYIGAFEIIQQDKDEGDYKHILESVKNWWDIIKLLLPQVDETLNLISRIVSSFEGLYTKYSKYSKSSSTLFLKNSFLLLLFLFI